MIGTRYHMLTVAEVLPKSRLRCICDCGAERTVRLGHFNAGYAKSCGCHVTQHGHTNGGKLSRTYMAYRNMVARCHNPRNKRFKDYGAKGIVVCERWRCSFPAFLDDMGECPEGMTIDREKNNLGYEPGNCRWVTRSTNQRNRACSLLWNVYGEVFETAGDAAKRHGVSGPTIRAWCMGRMAEGHWYPPKDGCSVSKKYGAEWAPIRAQKMGIQTEELEVA